MKFGRGIDREGFKGLPITSMIDVVFLLLVYFLVTARMTPSEAQLAAALKTENQGSAQATNFQPQIIVVENSGGKPSFRLGDRVMFEREQLTQILKLLPKERGVFVRVRDDVPVSAATAAVQACRDAGFTKVTYVPAP